MATRRRYAPELVTLVRAIHAADKAVLRVKKTVLGVAGMTDKDFSRLATELRSGDPGYNGGRRHAKQIR